MNWTNYMLSFILVFSITMIAEGQEYTPEAKQVYQSILRLNFDQARKELQNLDASNVVDAHLENYIDFIELFVLEDENMYEARYPSKNKRLNYLASKGNRASPYYLFIQADIRLQWAVIEAKFSDFLTAFRDIRTAYALLEENHRRFPDFKPNEKDRGMLIALVGMLPDKYQWGVEWLSGIPGDMLEGEMIMRNCLRDTNFVFEDETRAMYAMLQLHLFKNEQKGWEILQQVTVPANESGLMTFLLANTALNTKRLEEARDYLEAYERSANQFHIPHLDYLAGFVEMYSGNYELAIEHFDAFLNSFNGLHYIKSAWLNKGFCHYILGHHKAYLKCLEHCKTEGDDLIDEDKYALNFAKEEKILPVSLLKVRLYYDGGNPDQAWEVLKQSQGDVQQDPQFQKVAKYYRARILHEQGQYAEAINKYALVLNSADPEWEYYATNSALQIGLIYEDLGECSKARYFYQRCLEIPSETFRTSLHQKAKAGIVRCRK